MYIYQEEQQFGTMEFTQAELVEEDKTNMDAGPTQ